LALGRRRRRSLDKSSYGSQGALQLGIVFADRELATPRQHPGQPHEGSDHLDAGAHGHRALEHVGQDHRAMFRENVRRITQMLRG
jgi:hypothetical protein